MTNYPDGMTRYDFEHVEGRHMTNDSDRYRPSRSTGEYGESSEYVREIARAARRNQPIHRSQVLWMRDDWFAIHCHTCGWLDGEVGPDKAALEGVARDHETVMS